MDIETLELHGVSHILTVDSVPLPRNITQLSTISNKFIQGEFVGAATMTGTSRRTARRPGLSAMIQALTGQHYVAPRAAASFTPGW